MRLLTDAVRRELFPAAVIYFSTGFPAKKFPQPSSGIEQFQFLHRINRKDSLL
jgi:hypothetical protein